MNREKSIIFTILFLAYSSLNGQGFQFDKLTIKDGLSDNSIRDILQDSRGYLWMATLNGLDRYDGKGFKNYTTIPGDETSLKNSRIQRIIEDAQGYIWCMTLNGKVSRVDPSTNEVLDIYPNFIAKDVSINDFKVMPSGDLWLWGEQGCVQIQYKEHQDKPLTKIYDHQRYLPKQGINFVQEDKYKNIWIGTQGGLVKLIQKGEEEVFSNYFEGASVTTFSEVADGLWFGTSNNGVKKYIFKEKSFQSLPTILTESLAQTPVLYIEPIQNHRVLIGSTTALYDVDIEQQKVVQRSHPGLQNISEIFTDSYQNHWLASDNRGVYKYDSAEKNITYFDLKAASRVFLGDADKQLFFEDSRKNFWVGIYGGGVFLYNQKDNQFTPYTYAENQPNHLSSNLVLCLMEDQSKNLWIGTMHGGVNKLNLSKSVFTWHHPMKAPRNNFDNEVRAATADRIGNLWVGSKGGKIFCYDANFKKIRTFPDDLSKKEKGLFNNISAYYLYFDTANNLWVGTKGKGVFVLKKPLRKQTQEIEVIHFDKYFDAANTKALDEIFAIQEDKHGQFWIGSHTSGLTLLQAPFTGPTFSTYTKENTNGKLVSNMIRCLFIDQSENLWVGTSHGISVLETKQLQRKEKQFLPITNDKKDLKSLSYNSVDYIFQASDQTIYVSTMGGGLNQLEKVNWAEGQFQWKFYNKTNGLSTNKIYGIAEDNEQNLWISSVMGINKFNPATETFENFFIETDKGLNYFTESCVAKVPSNEIIFGHNQGFLSFNPEEIIKDATQYPVVFSQLHVNGVVIDPKTSDILTKSIEFEQAIKLNHQQNSIQLDFAVLDYRHPDRIQFSYKLENFDSKWSTPLTVNSALYQNLKPGDYTFWLKGTNSDGIAIQAPTQLHISIAPPFFKSPLGYLLLALSTFIVLGLFFSTYNRQIEAKHQLDFSEKVNEKKLKYYTNISHEFKTPLTMILSPIEDILEHKSASPEIITYANHIRKNATYLLELVEQILDFRKIREEKMPLAVAHLNISDFVKNIYYVFKPLAEKSDIDFFLFLSNQEIKGYLDPKIVEKILFNLLSNAFKHTPPNKRIELSLQFSPNGWLNIYVKDEGKGMEQKVLSRLFERFYQSENSSGLGLFFVKELVTLHKGKIEVESGLHQGTTFILRLPISKSDYMTEEIATTLPILQTDQPPIIAGLPISNQEISVQNHRDRILIIDDNEEMRHYIGDKLKTKYQVWLAANGKEGLQIAIQEIPDIIICDVMMPVLDGIATTRALRKNFNTSHIPIILLTANSSDEKRYQGIEMGADDYLTKPFNNKYLQLKIDSLIQQRKQLRTRFQQAPELSVDTLTRSEQDKIFIQQVTEIINKNLGTNDFSVEFLAKKVNCSRTNFYKKMKGVTGETPHEFIKTIQMKKAALLLRETTHRIADIGYMVGFNDSNYFSKSFKKHFGKTPKAYQKEVIMKD